MLILSVAIAFLTLGALWFAAVLNEHDMHPMRRLTELMKRPALEVALVALVAIGLIHHGATKGVRSGEGNAPEMDAGTWTVPDDAVEELRSGLPPSVPCAAYGGTNDLSSVTNLCFAEIAVASDSVLVSVAWPTNWALPLSTLLLYARHDLASGGWERVASAVAPEGVNAVDVEMPFAILPAGGSNRTFFAAGTLYDSDGDGLSDSDERLICGTDPNSFDTDSDLVSDGDEVARGTDPLSGDTDGDGIDDCHESGGFTRDPIPDTFSTWSVVADLTAQMLANTQMCVDVALQLPAAALDESFSRIAVDPNGIVVLHNGGEMSLPARPQCQDMRYAQFPSNTFAIAGYWAGLSLSTNEPASSVRLLAGPNPIVEYSNMRLASAASPEGNLVSFQIWLPVSSFPFGTLIYQMSGAETDGRRASVGMCGRNGAFRASYCFCDPGRMADGMVLYADPGYGTDPLNPDSDADGIGDGAELDLGTDPTQPDTDGDGMPDGWEQDHGFDPFSSSGDDGALGDPDEDGLLNIDEYLNNCDPHAPDSDNDGVGDMEEVEGNSDPANAGDGGIAPATNLFRALTFNINGDYAAWEMTIEGIGPIDTRLRRISMGHPNATQNVTLQMRKGNKYRLSMRWLNSDGHSKPNWYCWQAKIDGLPTEKTYNDYSVERKPDVAEVIRGNGWVADNAEGLLTSHVHQRQGNGGNVAGQKEAMLYVLDVDVSVCAPSGDAWPELDASRVILDNEQLRIKAEIRPRLNSMEECRRLLGDEFTVRTAGTCPDGAELSLESNAFFENLNDRSVLKVWRTRNQLKSLGLLPEHDNDGVDEMAWMDIVETSGQSYADSEAFATLGYQFRGKATSDNEKTLESTPPNSVPSESFFKAAGCEVVTAEYSGFVSPKRQIMNQADIFYYSGHGSLSDGSLHGGFSPGTITSEWSKDLITVVFSGCAVLNIGRYRSKSFKSTARLRWALKTFSKTNISPGLSWMGKGPKYYLGYCWRAPLDNKGASDIAASFVANMSLGIDVVNAWKFANNNYAGRNACVIDCSGSSPVFWYWDETEVGPVWTAIQKGTPLWP